RRRDGAQTAAPAQKPVGELATGACIGTSSAAALCFEATPPPLQGTLVRQSSNSALHLCVMEVSPAFRHRLELQWPLLKSGAKSLCFNFWHGQTPALITCSGRSL